MIKDDRLNRIVRQQWPLLTLILLIFGIFILQTALGREWYGGFMTVPAAVVESWHRLLGGETSGEDIRVFGALLASAFLHGSLEHVFFNMVFLWIFAALAVELLGHRWMLAIFAISAIAGSLCHTLLNAEEWIPMLGASGAVMGFQGAYLGLAVRWRLPNPHVWPMSRPIPPANLAALAVVGISFDFIGLMDHDQVGVAYGAHIGGFLAGLFLASFAVRSVRASLGP